MWGPYVKAESQDNRGCEVSWRDGEDRTPHLGQRVQQLRSLIQASGGTWQSRGKFGASPQEAVASQISFHLRDPRRIPTGLTILERPWHAWSFLSSNTKQPTERALAYFPPTSSGEDCGVFGIKLHIQEKSLFLSRVKQCCQLMGRRSGHWVALQ